MLTQVLVFCQDVHKLQEYRMDVRGQKHPNLLWEWWEQGELQLSV